MMKRKKRAKHCERAYMRGGEGRSQNREAGSSCVIADGLRREGELLPKYPHFLVVMMMSPSSCKTYSHIPSSEKTSCKVYQSAPPQTSLGLLPSPGQSLLPFRNS